MFYFVSGLTVIWTNGNVKLGKDFKTCYIWGASMHVNNFTFFIY